MMALKNFVLLLASTGLDVAYQHFDVGDDVEMPFITYQEVTSNNFVADGKVYAAISHLYVTLWTSKKDIASEQKLEKVLDDNDIPWSKNESYLEEERCFEITYEVEV